jgi:regulator of replication initiation timing
MGMWVALMVISAFYYWSKVEREKLKHGYTKGGKHSKDLSKKVAYLLEENEDLKEEIEQIKYALGLDPKDSISIDLSKSRKKKEKKTPLDGLTPYEREQLRLDNQNKPKY